MTIEIIGIEQLKEYVGKPLGYSNWYTLTQQQIDQFANATGDHQ